MKSKTQNDRMMKRGAGTGREKGKNYRKKKTRKINRKSERKRDDPSIPVELAFAISIITRCLNLNSIIPN